MRRLSVKAIKGDEVLARDVISGNDKILLPAGSKLKAEYRNHLQRLGVTAVYVTDALSIGVCSERVSEDAIREECLNSVRAVLERFSYNTDVKQSGIHKIAEEIMNEVLEERNVVYCLAGVRQHWDELYSHSINVAVLASLIALHMGIAREDVKDITVGSLLHDIGYNAVSVKKGRQQEAAYTQEEKRELKKHVIYGYSMVEKEEWLSNVSKYIILEHHEMINGTGYPFKRDGEHMTTAIKIVSLCNEFDSLVYGRHGKSLKVHEAIEYIISQSGQRFEHSVVAAFNEIVAAYPNGTIVVTNEGDIGIVLRQNNCCPTRPVIRLLQNKENIRYNDWIERNLTECLTLFIVDTLETI